MRSRLCSEGPVIEDQLEITQLRILGVTLMRNLISRLAAPLAAALEIESPLSRRHRLVSAGAQITTLLRSVEDLSPTCRAETAAILDRELINAKNPWLEHLPRSVVRVAFSERLDVPLAGLAAGASIALLVRRKQDALTVVLEALQLALSLQQSVRYTGLGRDGSDHALIVTQAGLLGSSLLRPIGGERIGLWFVGAQGLLAYLASGSVKLTSPLWRHGTGLSGALQPISYGHEKLNQFLETHPTARRLMAWSVIVTETFYPLIMVLPKPMARAWSGALLGMHLSIAYFMGLNRFLPAFASMHPATLGVRDDVWKAVSRRCAA